MQMNFSKPTKSGIFLLFLSSVFFVIASCHQEKKESADVYTVHSYPLPVDVSSSNFIKKIRIQHNLKAIKDKDQRKEIRKLPMNTYFFLDVDSMVNRDFPEILECPASNKMSNTTFELHKKDGKVFLCIFVTYEIATNISELDGEEVKELTVFSQKSQDFNHLALVPVDRIVKAQKRKIYLAQDHFIYIMDIVLK